MTTTEELAKLHSQGLIRPCKPGRIKGLNLAISNIIIHDLKDLGAYLQCHAMTGSMYVKFVSTTLRSLRISDHVGIKKYKYKWNLIKSLSKHYKTQDSYITRFYYNFYEIQLFESHIREFNKRPKFDKLGSDFSTLKGIFGR